MPAIISIIGHSQSGKTTLIEKLVRELASRGYRVGTIKHAPSGSTLDEPNKDTWRHIAAGSAATAIVSNDRVALLQPVTPETNLYEIMHLFGEAFDIVIVEGFKQQASTPKIEVHRKESGPLLTDIAKRVAIATDEPVESKVRQFDLNDPKPLADFIEEGYIKPYKERLSLYVNGAPIPLSAFPREFITNVLLAMASSLKGVVPDIETLEFFYRKTE